MIDSAVVRGFAPAAGFDWSPGVQAASARATPRPRLVAIRQPW